MPTTTKAGYTFDGWFTSASGGTKVTASYIPIEDMTLYAQWTAGETYAITFVNYDNTELKVYHLPYGSDVTYDGETPTRPDDEQYTYTFKGWDPEIVVVTGNATYKATYYEIPIVDPDTGDETKSKTKGLDANGQFLLVTFGAIISLAALALIITRKRL